MHPSIIEQVAAERVKDMQKKAAAAHLARRPRARGRLFRALAHILRKSLAPTPMRGGDLAHSMRHPEPARDDQTRARPSDLAGLPPGSPRASALTVSDVQISRTCLSRRNG